MYEQEIELAEEMQAALGYLLEIVDLAELGLPLSRSQALILALAVGSANKDEVDPEYQE